MNRTPYFSSHKVDIWLCFSDILCLFVCLNVAVVTFVSIGLGFLFVFVLFIVVRLGF